MSTTTGTHSEALEVLQPVTTPATAPCIYFRTRDTSNPWYIPTYNGTRVPLTFKLVPAPFGRSFTRAWGPDPNDDSVQGENGAGGGWTHVPEGTQSVTISGQPTGLHLMQLWRYPGGKDYYDLAPCRGIVQRADPRPVRNANIAEARWWLSRDMFGNEWRRLYPQDLPCTTTTERRWRIFRLPPQRKPPVASNNPYTDPTVRRNWIAPKSWWFAANPRPFLHPHWARGRRCDTTGGCTGGRTMRPWGAPPANAAYERGGGPDANFPKWVVPFNYDARGAQRRGFYWWIDHDGAHRPELAVLTVNYCDDAVRAWLISMFCARFEPYSGQVNSRRMCWAEDDAGDKVYLAPCSYSPDVDGGIGDGGT